jgi:hypothetical protein
MRSHFTFRSVVPLVALGVAALLGIAAPAQAGPRIHVEGTFVIGHRPPAIAVPSHVVSWPEWRRYREFYAGRVHHRGHHHDHALYRFPVALGGRVVWRSYPYCRGHLFPEFEPLPTLAVDYVYVDGHVSRYGHGHDGDRHVDDDEDRDGYGSRNRRGYHGYDDEHGD